MMHEQPVRRWSVDRYSALPRTPYSVCLPVRSRVRPHDRRSREWWDVFIPTADAHGHHVYGMPLRELPER